MYQIYKIASGAVKFIFEVFSQLRDTSAEKKSNGDFSKLNVFDEVTIEIENPLQFDKPNL